MALNYILPPSEVAAVVVHWLSPFIKMIAYEVNGLSDDMV